MRMRQTLRDLIAASLLKAREAGEVAFAEVPPFDLKTPKVPEHGDFSTNAALLLASQAKRPPRQVAEAIRSHLDAPAGLFAQVTIAGPGFINFYLSDDAWRGAILEIHRLGQAFGDSTMGAGRRVQVEFVSANPTGPLHIGHGRGAAQGDALANLLTAAGYKVEREYYINDVGNQINTLGKSLYFRALEAQGQTVDFPEDGYQGDYMRDLAREYLEEKGDLPGGGAVEAVFQELGQYAGDRILAGIRQDLDDFGVGFDRWFSETSLYTGGWVDKSFALLREKGYLYEEEGALWFKATAFGDDKDRVVRRSTGAYTYFASDIAYHLEKFTRGFDLVVDIWGADHHGYVPRLTAATEALGYPNRLKVILVQLVSLLRQGEPVAMTTRGGTFVTLREVLDEVGKDAARFIFLTRRADAQLDFDLEVAKAQTSENQVYYVQYAHARLCRVFSQPEAESAMGNHPDPARLPLLTQPEEMEIIKLLANYPDLVEGAAHNLEPHRLTYFLTDLASRLHSYYYKHRFISEDADLTHARLWLVKAVQTVIAHGLGILGVTAPESM